MQAHILFTSFFFNDTATTEIYTLSLHDALPILFLQGLRHADFFGGTFRSFLMPGAYGQRSEEHTSELQSRENLVCRLLLEKKKQNKKFNYGLYVDATHTRKMLRF